MDGFRILVANEPMAYREAMAAALRCLHPEAEIAEMAGPHDASVPSPPPHLLICSDPAMPGRLPAPVWVLLYPGGTSNVVVCLDGKQRRVTNITFDEILAVVGRAARLAAQA